MKETGIIMSGNHPKLILDGIKTQSRRVVKPQPEDRYHWQRGMPFIFKGDILSNHEMLSYCPYGGVGDRLWVRATWSKNFKGQMLFKYQYEQLTAVFDSGDRPDWLPQSPPWPKLKWKPSIHLRKEDAGIWLEITEVRVERLHQIGMSEDLCKEGIAKIYYPNNKVDWLEMLFQFSQLWDSLDAKRGYGWEVNPWVWVISFKLLEREND